MLGVLLASTVNSICSAMASFFLQSDGTADGLINVTNAAHRYTTSS
jgi:hypothetical protein